MLHLIAKSYREERAHGSLRAAFAQCGYVKLPKLLDQDGLTALSRPVARLRSSAIRRSFVMPGVETPRRMSTVGGFRIAAEEPALAGLYTHEDVLSLLHGIAGGEIHRCQHRHEYMVANILSDRGDSHGWHLDDPAYALVLIVEAPPPSAGGSLEFIPRWRELCQQWGADPKNDVLPVVAKAKQLGMVEVRHHEAGDGYLLRASSALHRVAPLVTPGSRRVVLNLAYQDVRHQAYGDTATALYGEAVARDVVRTREVETS